jgi:hypothetical protein
MPLIKGKSKFIAAPRSIDHTVGGWYMTTGEPSPWLFDDDCGGEDEGGESDEYGSESEGMVRPEAERSGGGEGGVSFDMLTGSGRGDGELI